MNESPELNHQDLRFEYAWRWFALHAKQRVSMFNFFLIVIGIMANAYVFLILGNLKVIAGSLAIIGAIMSLVFIALDWRNHQLVHMGEELLRELENDELFINTTSSAQQGPLQREQIAGESPFFLKHWFLMEILQTIACVGFITAAVYAFITV